jgi:hypothetical protein
MSIPLRYATQDGTQGWPILRALVRRMGYEFSVARVEWPHSVARSLAEMFFEELSGTIQAVFREHYRLG